MKLRTLSIVVLVLAVLSAVVYFVQRPAPPPSTDPRVGQPLIGSETIEKTATLKLSDQGKAVSVVRQADNSWRVASYHDFPVDFSKLSRFINELGEAKVQRLVTSNPERIGRLEFKDTKIELLDSSNQPLTTVTIGKYADAGGRYIRFGEEQKAYLSNLNAWIDAESKNWAHAQLIELKPEDIAKAELSFPDGTALVVTRGTKDEPWQAAAAPAGQQLKPDRISSLLTTVTNLRFSDTVEPSDPRAQEARTHQRTIKLTTFDGKTVTVAMSRKPEEKKLKPPTPAADGKSGPAALGSVADLAKKAPDADSKDADAKSDDGASPVGPTPLTPEYETIPAGPVFVTVSHGEASAPINALMSRRAFQVADYVFTGLPQSRADLFEPAPAAPATAPASQPSPDAPPAPTP